MSYFTQTEDSYPYTNFIVVVAQIPQEVYLRDGLLTFGRFADSA